MGGLRKIPLPLILAGLVVIGLVVYLIINHSPKGSTHRPYTTEERKQMDQLNEQQRQERLQGKRQMPESHPERERTGKNIRVGMHRSELKTTGNYEVRFSDGIVWVQYGGRRAGGVILVFEDDILTQMKRVTNAFSLEDHPDAIQLRRPND